MAGKAKGKTEAVKKNPAVKRVRKTIPSTEFRIHAPGANEVFLAGDFNNWESNSKDFQMRKFKDNIWKKKVKLSPGRYEYQFVVDGNWCPDPVNPERQSNPFASENSVLTIS